MSDNRPYHTSESSFHRLITANADGIVIVDSFGIIRFANPAAEHLFNRSASLLLGTPFGYPIVADKPTEIDVVGSRNQVAVAEMRVVEIEWQEQPAYLASLRDITERKQAETDLRQRERFLALLNEITHTALKTEEFSVMLQLLADRLGKLFYADECYITLWDETRQLALPGAAYSSSHEQYLALSLQSQEKTITDHLLRTNKAIAINNIKKSPHANTRTAFLSRAQSLLGLPLISDEQKLGAVLITFTQQHDFSDEEIQRGEQAARHIALALAKARLYEQVKHYAENLEALATERTEELQTAYKQLQEMDQLKSDLIAHISHELRTPVANLRLYLNLLEDGPADKQMHYRDVLREQVRRLMKLIEGIIELSQLNNMSRSESYSVFDLNELVRSVVTAKKRRKLTELLELSFAASVNPLLVSGDLAQIRRMIDNLIDNAIQFTAKGTIWVKAFPTKNQQHVCLQVKDTGIGIAPDEIPFVFESFFRGQMISQLNIPGIGMGLAIVKRIVDFHNGEISVKSNPGQGSSFLVRLPAYLDARDLAKS